MARLGLPGRIMLILMAALAGLVVATLAINRWERAARRAADATPYPRLEQAAGIIDLMRKADPSLRPAILQAITGPRLHAAIEDAAPVEADGLRRAPRIEARLQALAGGTSDEIRAYTMAPTRRWPHPEVGAEGRLMRTVWCMPDGRFLRLDAIEPHRAVSLRLLGLAPGIWIGLLGIGVAGLALHTTQRELRPLQHLTAAVAAFDGGPSPIAPEPRGAPDIRRLAAAVHGMQARVGALMRERSFLIGAISHDLKTYLTRLNLRAETMPDAQTRARMLGDLDAMRALIDTSLAFARGTTVSPGRGPVDVADLVAVEIAERGALGQPVAASGADVTGAIVLGDPVALRRVLANLVDNALKFGRARVEVAIEFEAAGAGALRVVVDDDGPGLAEAEREAVFSPFYRVEGSRNRVTGGTGLGLAIARQIAEAHGGGITVTRSPLGGARFALGLPRAKRA